MHVSDVTEQELTIMLSVNEAMILNNALNEICNGIDVPEFENRIGASISEARSLLLEFSSAIGRAKLK